MATLVLTAVGTAIGGPVGGAIGAMIGQQVDTELLGAPARHGSRLKELAVQTSSYGTQIPAVFGAMRVAGTVIWSTDLIEDKTRSGGSKSRPATVNYSYRVSLAIALSSRPIVRIGRVWADGNLIRGAAGDLKIDTQFRVYNGHQNQAPDRLLASAEVAGQCPAYRGIAYAVFEDLQLADFGNRIPLLTFELFERDGLVSLADVVLSMSSGSVGAVSSQTMAGYAALGDSLSEAAAPLLDAFPVKLVAQGKNLNVQELAVSPTEVPLITVAASENEQEFARPKQAITPGGHIPRLVSIRYYDAERDYQAGIQQSNGQSIGRRTMRIELPAVLSAQAARQLVDRKEQHIQSARTTWAGTIIRREDCPKPGDCFCLADGSKWHAEEIEDSFGTLTVKAKAAMPSFASASPNGVPGRHIPSLDQQIGATQLVVVDAPLFDGRDPARPNLLIFAAGTGAGWRRAALSLNVAGDLTDIGVTSPRAIMGLTRNLLPEHHPFLEDADNHLEVDLLNDGMALVETNVSPGSPDAPIFWIDGEFLRAGKVTALGGNRYRLSRFIRSCFSPQPTMQAHEAGSKIVLVDPGTARLIVEHPYALGEIVNVEGLGLNDVQPVTASLVVKGLAVVPTSPVHGSANWLPDGSLELRWVRRSRLDIGWVDGVDQALAEDKEAYSLNLIIDDIAIKEWAVSENRLLIPSSELAALALPINAVLTFSVRQSGRFAQSAPLIINFP